MRVGLFLVSTLVAISLAQQDENAFIEVGMGFDGAMNADLDRIAQKLSNERMQRLLGAPSGDMLGLKELLNDDVTQTAEKALRVAEPAARPSPVRAVKSSNSHRSAHRSRIDARRSRFRQKHAEKESHSSATSFARTATASSASSASSATAATSLEELAKRELNLERQLKDIEGALREQTADQERRRRRNLSKLKSEIVKEVMAQVHKGGGKSEGGRPQAEEVDDEDPDALSSLDHEDPEPTLSSFRQKTRSAGSSSKATKTVLLQLEHTLEALKKQKGKGQTKGPRARTAEPKYTDDWHEEENTVSMEDEAMGKDEDAQDDEDDSS